MQLMVHFSVGLAGGLLVLTVVDVAPRVEFPAAFASGVRGVVPDGHWLLAEAGATGPAAVWKAAHGTAWANLFPFHGLLDHYETGRGVLEGGAALLLMLVVVAGYALLNDWRVE
jgi:hypothetical protein